MLLAELTQSESSELLLVDEKISEMQKLIENDHTVENFVLPEGLAGNCALQKRLLTTTDRLMIQFCCES